MMYFDKAEDRNIVRIVTGMCEAANEYGKPYEYVFNKVLIVARPGDTPEELLKLFGTGGSPMQESDIKIAFRAIRDKFAPLRKEWVEPAEHELARLEAEICRLRMLEQSIRPTSPTHH